jgi:hypothetical protein
MAAAQASKKMLCYITPHRLTPTFHNSAQLLHVTCSLCECIRQVLIQVLLSTGRFGLGGLFSAAHLTMENCREMASAHWQVGKASRKWHFGVAQK